MTYTPRFGCFALAIGFLLSISNTLLAQQETRQASFQAPDWPTQNNLLRLRNSDTLQVQQLYLDLDATLFLRNTEYFSPLAAGYTNINYRLTPALTYAINPRATFTGGLQYDGVFGDDSVDRFFPIFRLEYQATSWLRIILGSIYGGLAHGLDGPMYNYERTFFTHYYQPEAGVQLLARTRHWCADLWMNWENYLNAYTYEEEQFVIGTRQEITWLDNKETPTEGLTITTPFSAMVAHHGGQFSLVDTNNGSILNAHAALAATLHLGHRHHFLRLYLPYYCYRDISGEDWRHNASEMWHYPYVHGWGIYPQLSWQQGFGVHNQQPTTVMLTTGYWHGYHYISSRGDHLFQSIAFDDKYETFPRRNMLAFSASLEHYYQNLALGLDLQLYHDIGLQATYYAYGIYMRWTLKQPLLNHRA